MPNWQERMRQIEEEEKRRILAREEEAKIDGQTRQEALLKSAKDAELKTREKNERKIKILETLDRLNVRKTLEDIRSQVWQNQGTIIEQKTDSGRFVRLSFEFETAIPETEYKTWDEVVGTHTEHYEFSGWSTVNETVSKSKSRVLAWHKVIKPSYLEVGINYPSPFFNGRNGRVADLYVLDTDVDLWTVKEGDSLLGVREIYYTDRKGNRFSKKPRPGIDLSWILRDRVTYTSYGLNDNHTAPITSLGLSPDINESLANEFLNSCFAVSSALRKSQRKLPLQLQEQGKNYRKPIS